MWQSTLRLFLRCLRGRFPVLNALNIMHLQTAQSAVLSAVIFNALIIIALIPLALRGVKYRPMGAAVLLEEQSVDLWSGRNHHPVPWNQADRYADHEGRAGMKRLVFEEEFCDRGTDDGRDNRSAGNHLSVACDRDRAGVFPKQANGQLIEPQRRSDWLAHRSGRRLRDRAISILDHRRRALAMTPRPRWHRTSDQQMQQLIDRVKGDVAGAQAENPGVPVPVDLVTASASGLDPDITPAAAKFQIRAWQLAAQSDGS